MDINLTPTEERYLKFLKAYQEGHGGLGPSYLEIMDAMDRDWETTAFSYKIYVP